MKEKFEKFNLPPAELQAVLDGLEIIKAKSLAASDMGLFVVLGGLDTEKQKAKSEYFGVTYGDGKPLPLSSLEYGKIEYMLKN
jgi:hypothetical protein